MTLHEIAITLVLVSVSALGLAQQPLRKLSPLDSTRSGYKPDLVLANPTNKSVELANDDYKAPFYRFDVRYTKKWFDFKERLDKATGLQLSINYSSVFLGASSKISEENVSTAASGIFDATLKWNFINRKKGKNKGTLIFWTDWRHLYYGDVAPQFLFLETGSATIPATKFNKWSFRVLEFYYQQTFAEDFGLVVGKIDMADWFTYNGLLHPMMHFSDLAFSVNPTVSWSNPGFGVVVGGWLDKKKQFGLVLGLNDVAGDDVSQNNFLDWGIKQWANGKFLKMVEFNYSPEKAKYYFNRLSLTYWHSDELAPEDDSFFTSGSSQGFTIQGTWLIDNKYIPVVTFGMSDGEGGNSLSKLNFSVMHAWYFTSHDLFAIGLNYTRSTISDRGQFLSEIFYRFTVSKALAVTPVVKFIFNPALNPDKSLLLYYGLRSRMSF